MNKTNMIDLLTCLSIESMDDIASRANEMKKEEFRKVGFKLNHELSSGDVRLILKAYRNLLAKEKNDRQFSSRT